jgi:uncharacterized protein (DUF433 family)
MLDFHTYTVRNKAVETGINFRLSSPLQTDRFAKEKEGCDDGMKLGDEYIEVNSGKLSGTPLFHGTRVPIKNLFDYLEGGDDIDTFLDDFPTVERNQVMGVLEIVKANLLLNRKCD